MRTGHEKQTIELLNDLARISVKHNRCVNGYEADVDELPSDFDGYRVEAEVHSSPGLAIMKTAQCHYGKGWHRSITAQEARADIEAEAAREALNGDDLEGMLVCHIIEDEETGEKSFIFDHVVDEGWAASEEAQS